MDARRFANGRFNLDLAQAKAYALSELGEELHAEASLLEALREGVDGEDKPLFSPGFVGATPGALEVLEQAGADPLGLVERHTRGDWGEVDSGDRAENERSVE